MADEDEEIIYEEVPEPHVIETGDSVKVKQVLDDATVEGIEKVGYTPNYSWENLKLFLMFLSCVFAMVAQFYPMPFPQSRPLLGICCAAYFVLSSVLQLMITFIDQDTIIITKQHAETGLVLRIRTSFARFQEHFTLIIQGKDPKSPCTTAQMYVGRYFTAKGEFDEDGYCQDLQKTIKRYEQKLYKEFTYDHKSD